MSAPDLLHGHPQRPESRHPQVSNRSPWALLSPLRVKTQTAVSRPPGPPVGAFSSGLAVYGHTTAHGQRQACDWAAGARLEFRGLCFDGVTSEVISGNCWNAPGWQLSQAFVISKMCLRDIKNRSRANMSFTFSSWPLASDRARPRGPRHQGLVRSSPRDSRVSPSPHCRFPSPARAPGRDGPGQLVRCQSTEVPNVPQTGQGARLQVVHWGRPTTSVTWASVDGQLDPGACGPEPDALFPSRSLRVTRKQVTSLGRSGPCLKDPSLGTTAKDE